VDGILIPIAGVVAALGVAVLLCTSSTPLRVVGAVLAGAGGLPLALSRTSQAHTLLDRPALLGVGVVAAVVALAVLTLVFMRYPWLVPPLALVIGLRIPLRTPPSPTDHLLPLYLVLAAGTIALVLHALRGNARPNRLGYVGYALAVYVVIAAASLAWLRPLSTTCAPAWASARAKYCPKPRLVPVIKATFPVRSKNDLARD
jgi:hypothetical protein